jgi:deoxyribodipyrimidine photo-lyase
MPQALLLQRRAEIAALTPELTQVPAKFIHAPWTMDAATQVACGVMIGRDYPTPVVDHAAARECTLTRFKAVRGGNIAPEADNP